MSENDNPSSAQNCDFWPFSPPRADAICRRVRKANVFHALFGDYAHPVEAGRSRLIQRIAVGTSSELYTAHDPQLDRLTAVKLFRMGTTPTQTARDRLLARARLQREVQHPHLPRLHQVGMLEDRVYVAMELVRGATLANWSLSRNVRRRRADAIAILELFIAIGRGLQVCHEHGLTHGDLKPSHLLVTHDRRAMLLDTGLSPDPERVGVGRILVTPYMAPERWRGQPASPASDIFAFCAVLYEALFGRIPFDASTPEQFHSAVLRGIEQPVAGKGCIPESVIDSLRQGLRSRPHQRLPGMDALLVRLESGQRQLRRSGWLNISMAASTLFLL